MRVGLIGGSKMFPAAKQKTEVEAAKVGRLYELSAGETVQNVIDGIRDRNTLVVAGLYAFRLKRRELVAALEKLAAKRITVERARDGRTADAGTAGWIIEDLAAMAGEAKLKSRENASAQGKLGGKPPSAKPMTKTAARIIWKRKDIGLAEKVELIGMPERSIYRWLKEKTGRKTGPLPKAGND